MIFLKEIFIGFILSLGFVLFIVVSCLVWDEIFMVITAINKDLKKPK